MLPQSILEYDWYHPRIRFIRVARSNLDILGPFEQEMRKLAEMAAGRTGKTLPDDTSSIFMPVHELQIPNITHKFPDVEILHPDISVQALAQSSIRLVVIANYRMVYIANLCTSELS